MSIDVEELAGEVAALRIICSALLLHVRNTHPASLDSLAEYLAGFRSIAGEHVVEKLRVRSRKAVKGFEACLEDAIANVR